MLVLRPYQEAAKAAVYEHLRTRQDNPCAVIPTGGGKTPVIASICADAVSMWNGRVLILAHVKELLEQITEKLHAADPDLGFGVYSAGLKRRDIDKPVIVAGIQSVYRRASQLGAFNLIVVDQAHMIPLDGEGMYQQFLADAQAVNPAVRVIGFTATPFRMKCGMICTPDHFLNHICYEVGVRELIRDGYLSPLITKDGSREADTTALHVRGGEFVAGELEDLMDRNELVESACGEIVQYAADRRSVLIFASGIKHGRHVARVLREKHGVDCQFVCSETPTSERDKIVERFKAGTLRCLCNVNVLTTGFDASHIDCVAMLRPTLSPGLYYQMVGRGFRPHPDKRNCLVLDFGGNVLRHGPVDQIRVAPKSNGGSEAPAKKCPECHSVIAAGYARCPDCGHAFPEPERREHEPTASRSGILSSVVTNTEYDVRDVTYRVHIKLGASENDPKSMRVDYRLGPDYWQSEWVCFEHTGYARHKAVAWWKQRSPDPVPETAQRAVEIAEGGGVAYTEKITIRSVMGEGFDRIVGYKLGPMPEPLPICFSDSAQDDIPF